MKVIFYFSIYLLKDSCKSISDRQKPCLKIESRKIEENYGKIVSDAEIFCADRVRDKQDMVFVEAKGRALLSLRRSENGV